MLQTVDGFPLQSGIDFISDKPNRKLNKWSWKKTIKVEVKDFWLNPATVVWKGQSVRVADYEFFKMGIHRDMREEGITKEEALDEFFEIMKYVPDED